MQKNPTENFDFISRGFILLNKVSFFLLLAGLIFILVSFPLSREFFKFGVYSFTISLVYFVFREKHPTPKVLILILIISQLSIILAMNSWAIGQMLLWVSIVLCIVCIFFHNFHTDHKLIYFQNKLLTYQLFTSLLICFIFAILSHKNIYRFMIKDDPIGAELYEKTIKNPEDSIAKNAFNKYLKSTQ